MVLNRVICSARNELCDLSPFISDSLVRVDDEAVLFFCPFIAVDPWIQVVMPPVKVRLYCCLPLAALLANPAWKGGCDGGPVTWPMLLDHLHNNLVFLLAPRPLHEAGVKHLLPAVEALHVSAVFKER